MVLDLLLGALLVFSALASMQSKDLLKSGIFFLTFGMISGLVWVRLSAPDIAMVEVVLGAGITSVLIFKLMRSASTSTVKVSTFRRLWAGAISSAVFLWMIGYTLGVPVEERVSTLVFENLYRSGVESAVTAVLLNFRGYDTLLEVGVITLAIFGVLMFGMKGRDYEWHDPMVKSLSRMFFPLIAFFSLYLTYLGAFSVGGAFQGGSLLAGGLVLLALSGQSINLPETYFKPLLLFSLAVFTIVGLLYALVGYGFLTFPIELATASIILIELSIWLSTALLLYTAYRGRL